MNPSLARFVDCDALFSATLALVREASELLRAHFRTETLSVELKSDGSPVTAADKFVDALVQRRLPELFAAPVISEESPLPASAYDLSTFWLVDPLDGTQNFISGEDEFSIVLALVLDGVPQLGFVAAPAKGLIFGAIRGCGVWRFALGEGEGLPLRGPCSPPIRVVTSRYPKPEALARVKQFCADSVTPPAQLQQVGSAYKSMLLLDGRADLVISYDRVSLWDLGGVECVLHQAGCALRSIDTGEPIRFDLSLGTGVGGYFAYHPAALDHFLPTKLCAPLRENAVVSAD